MNRLAGFAAVFGAGTHTGVVWGWAWKASGAIALRAADLAETYTRSKRIVPVVRAALAIIECGKLALDEPSSYKRIVTDHTIMRQLLAVHTSIIFNVCVKIH